MDWTLSRGSAMGSLTSQSASGVLVTVVPGGDLTPGMHSVVRTFPYFHNRSLVCSLVYTVTVPVTPVRNIAYFTQVFSPMLRTGPDLDFKLGPLGKSLCSLIEMSSQRITLYSNADHTEKSPLGLSPCLKDLKQ